MNYTDFIRRKMSTADKRGIPCGALPAFLRADQRLCVQRALETGPYAIFADCGLGKTLDELEWARQVAAHGPVLILAPLCVGLQTCHIAKQFGYDVTLCKSQEDVRDGVNITNYDRLDKFSPESFAGIVLDESSILKNYAGKTRNAIIDSFKQTRFKLACTATPAPNDHMELGNHAEFLGLCTRAEMLSKYFVHDGGETQTWRLKGHAAKPFWDWVGTWATTYSRPSDINPSFSDDGFELPQLLLEQHILYMAPESVGYLIDMPAETLGEARKIKRKSIDARIERAVEIASGVDTCVLWCDLNDEGDALEEAMPSARQLKGSQSIEEKEEILWGFTKGEIKRLITKQKITSFGLNWQHCNTTVFVGPNYSYEQAYQAIKRFHRFGQKRPVTAHWVMMDLEYNVFKALHAKMQAHTQMKEALTCKA